MKIDRHRNSNAGVALIMAVVMLALLTLLFIALFSLSRTELRTASVYANQLEARTLSETATNLVIGQIRDSTGILGETWASQPGAIRRWNAAGQFVAGHKLYSDSDMVISTTEKDLSSDLPAMDWDQLGARYVDLNEPVLRSSGGTITAHYPIVDPTAAYPTTTPATYQGPGAVEGFGFDVGPVNNTVQAANHTARLPMPVEWLYILEDGTVGHLDSNNTFVPAGEATQDNPIVGRVAFWADDETAKVNINTASEPSFWDLPRAVGGTFTDDDPWSNINPEGEDLFYSKYPPARNEYQRYPGHPASTALSPVLFPGELTDIKRNLIYSMIPRVEPGIVKTGNSWSSPLAIAPDEDRLFASVDEFLLQPDRQAQISPFDRDHLERSRFFLTAHSRASELNLFGFPKVCVWPIDSQNRADGNYYLTPADELFQFVSTMGWNDSNNNAIIDTNEARNAYIFQRVDKDVADAELASEPRNRQLLNYLKALTSVAAPGYGGNFAAKYNASVSQNDRDQILIEMFDYIRCTNLQDPYRSAAGKKDFVGTRGQIIPMRDGIGTPGEVSGFGRQMIADEFAMAFLCGVDPDYPWSNWEGEKGYDMIRGRSATFEHPDTKAIVPKPIPNDRIAIQPMMLVHAFCAAQGWRNVTEDWLKATVSGLHNLEVRGFATDSATTHSWIKLYNKDSEDIDIRDNGNKDHHNKGIHHARSWGGNLGIRSWLNKFKNNGTRDLIGDMVMVPKDPYGDGREVLRFQSIGDVTVNLFLDNNGHNSFSITPNKHINEITLTFPSADFPLPKLNIYGSASGHGGANNGDGSPMDPNDMWTWQDRRDTHGRNPFYPWGAPNTDIIPFVTPGNNYPTAAGYSNPTLPTLPINGSYENADPYITPPGTPDPKTAVQGTYTRLPGAVLDYVDVVRSLVYVGTDTNEPYPGDSRMIAGKRVIGASEFRPHFSYFSTTRMQDHILYHNPAGSHYLTGFSNSMNEQRDDPEDPDELDEDPRQIPRHAHNVVDTQLTDADYHFSIMPRYPRGYATSPSNDTASQHIPTGDFDNGVSLTPDGAYINKPDDGNNKRSRYGHYPDNFNDDLPYLSVTWQDQSLGTPLYAPNRQIPSPVMFGSLPTGIKRGQPWETLLFRPQSDHPNHEPMPKPPTFIPAAPDHLWLDLFWMPVIEPYAISEPHSTAGKINLNTQILPFSYITRDTGIHALMKSEEMLLIPDELGADYKTWDHSTPDYKVPLPPKNLRRKIDLSETLKQWEVKHQVDGTLFRTPGEICDLHLVPKMTDDDGDPEPYVGTLGGSVTYPQPTGTIASNAKVNTDMAAFWAAHSPTGDNSRERPYAHIYPRLTTKSNVFRVHIRAQAIGKSPNSAVDQVDPDRDNVLSEYRGSTVIERYIDPSEPGIPDYASIIATNPAALNGENLDNYYRFRVVHSKRFEP